MQFITVPLCGSTQHSVTRFSSVSTSTASTSVSLSSSVEKLESHERQKTIGCQMQNYNSTELQGNADSNHERGSVVCRPDLWAKTTRVCRFSFSLQVNQVPPSSLRTAHQFEDSLQTVGLTLHMVWPHRCRIWTSPWHHLMVVSKTTPVVNGLAPDLWITVYMSGLFYSPARFPHHHPDGLLGLFWICLLNLLILVVLPLIIEMPSHIILVTTM